MAEATTRKAIEAVWRIESARLIVGLVRLVRDIGLAEDLAQEALVTALERWPEIDTAGTALIGTSRGGTRQRSPAGPGRRRRNAA